jgi:glycerol uptake facilitator-like aquaporin
MNKFFAEFIGTYIFIFCVLIITENKKFSNLSIAILISLSMFVCVMITRYIYNKSHINFNPALTSTSLIKGDIEWSEFFLLVLIQIFSGIIAYFTFKICKYYLE